MFVFGERKNYNFSTQCSHLKTNWTIFGKCWAYSSNWKIKKEKGEDRFLHIVFLSHLNEKVLNSIWSLTQALYVQHLRGLVNYVLMQLMMVYLTLAHMFALSLLRFCGGLIKDIKRKAPFFASDFYDALNIQALSAILFIYLATVTNAITFGGLLGDATDNMQVGLIWERTQIVQRRLSSSPLLLGEEQMALQLLSVTVFLLLDAALYFASGSLLYFQHVSNYKNSLMKSGLSHKWGKEGEWFQYPSPWDVTCN